MPVPALVEVVHAGLVELHRDSWYDVTDAFFVPGGWCARLLRRIDGVEADVYVARDPFGLTFRDLVDGFRTGMGLHA